MSSFIQKLKDKGRFSYCDQKLGAFTIRPFRPEMHASVIAEWVSKDYAHFWGMGGWSQNEIHSFYEQLMRQADKAAFIGYWCEQPAFLLELYDPSMHPVGEHYPVGEGIAECTY